MLEESKENIVSRRQFLDVIGKSAIVTAAFSAVLMNSGCGGGGDDGGDGYDGYDDYDDYDSYDDYDDYDDYNDDYY